MPAVNFLHLRLQVHGGFWFWLNLKLRAADSRS